MAADQDRLGEAFENFAGDPFDRFHVRDVVEQHDELVPTLAADGIAVPRAARQARHHR